MMLLLVCTCAYIKRVKALRDFLLSEKNGVFGALYKACPPPSVPRTRRPVTHPRPQGAVIGTRLHLPVSLACVAAAVYTLILR